MKKILITGGCGFVGSSLAILFKKYYEDIEVVCLDNLKRRGSEINISRLKDVDVSFIHGDIRNKEDLDVVGECDLIIECSAEPSVMAGYGESPDYLINTNLLGTINCLEFARKVSAQFIFLSTSRVYPIQKMKNLEILERETRYQISPNQNQLGSSENGISEEFSLIGARSLYGATKLASEILIQEFCDAYDMSAIINRCGLLTGPWQFGKADQGVIVLWLARHFWKKELSYIGFGGSGKQVRDVLNITDLFNLLCLQIKKLPSYKGDVFNVGGGLASSISLAELTQACQELTGNIISIGVVAEERKSDIKAYITDNSKVVDEFGWIREKSIHQTLEEVADWLKVNHILLEGILK